MRKKLLVSFFLCLVMTLLVGVSAFACPEDDMSQNNTENNSALVEDIPSENITDNATEDTEPADDSVKEISQEEGISNFPEEPKSQENNNYPSAEENPREEDGDDLENNHSDELEKEEYVEDVQEITDGNAEENKDLDSEINEDESNDPGDDYPLCPEGINPSGEQSISTQQLNTSAPVTYSLDK